MTTSSPGATYGATSAPPFSAAPPPPLTPGQKAAATRRARRAAGLPPRASGRRRSHRFGAHVRTGPAFPPTPDVRALALDGLSKLEDALGAAATAVTPEQDAKFKVYQKSKAMALATGTTPAESRAWLRRSLIQMVGLLESML